VNALLGTEHVEALASAVAEADKERILVAMAATVAAGREPRRTGQALLSRLHEEFLALQAPALAQKGAGALGRRMGLPALVRAMETLGKALAAPSPADPRASVEVALLACAAPPGPTSLAGLAERLERLETALGALVGRSTADEGQPAPYAGRAAPAAPQAPVTGQQHPEGTLDAPTPPAGPQGPSHGFLAPVLAALADISAGQRRLAETFTRVEALLQEKPRTPPAGTLPQPTAADGPGTAGGTKSTTAPGHT
jgi:hypothetical protein